MSVTLEDIQSFSAEVSSLVRAGLPLEGNLADAGNAHSRRLEKMTSDISKALANGESLEDTIRAHAPGDSRMLTAAVAAGVRSGQLAESIEMLGDMADDLVDLRRRILQAISYPLTVVALGLVLFCVFIRTFLQRIHLAFDEQEGTDLSLVQQVIAWDAENWWWPIALPAIGIVGILLWVISGRAASMAFRGPERLLLVLPGVRGMIRDMQFYNLARMASLLVERDVPLADSLLLAGGCSGNRALEEACRTAAADITRGIPPQLATRGDWKRGQLPPLLATCLGQLHLPDIQFRERLQSIVAYYRRRLHISILWLRNIVPIAMFIIIGGGSVVLYAMTVFWPVAEMFRHIVAD